jgi:hypothetical protein
MGTLRHGLEATQEVRLSGIEEGLWAGRSAGYSQPQVGLERIKVVVAVQQGEAALDGKGGDETLKRG